MYTIPYSKDHLFMSQLPKNETLRVGNHMFDFEGKDYLEVVVNFMIGFFDNTISI
jgi:hypothetical protein